MHVCIYILINLFEKYLIFLFHFSKNEFHGMDVLNIIYLSVQISKEKGGVVNKLRFFAAILTVARGKTFYLNFCH